MRIQLKLLIPLAALVLMPLAACSKDEEEAIPARQVVAEVNGAKIMGDRFLVEYARFKKRVNIQQGKDEGLEKELRNGLLDNLIRDTLLEQEAAKAGIKITPEMEEEEVQSMLKGNSPARLQVILQEQGRTYEEWKASVKQNLTVERLLKQKVAPLVQLTDTEMKEYYDGHADEFRKDAQAHVFHILRSTFIDADRARMDLAEGKKFEDVARSVSTSPEAENGGDLGFIGKGQMPKELDEAIFRLGLNQVSKVIESPYGFNLLKVTEFVKPRLMTFAEAKDGIHKRLFQERLERKFEEWLQEIKKNAQIKIYSDRLYRL
ncbi:MAG: peptidyl-prolyl cis-trans isomerase [Nitrospinae bacterium]|nr:peptidyl-prolyl cis-trans isomerase [Nitrospinota bacterium]